MTDAKIIRWLDHISTNTMSSSPFAAAIKSRLQELKETRQTMTMALAEVERLKEELENHQSECVASGLHAVELDNNALRARCEKIEMVVEAFRAWSAHRDGEPNLALKMLAALDQTPEGKL